MKICSIVEAICVALFVLSCSGEKPIPEPETDGPALVRHILDASMGKEEGVKATLNPSDDGEVRWGAQETVTVFVGDVPYTFTGTNAEAAASARFEGAAPAELGTYVMLSPRNPSASKSGGTISTELPASQTGFAGSYAEGTIILAGTSSTSSVTCKHVCSGVRFKTGCMGVTMVTLQGNNGERIAGNFSFSFSGGSPLAGIGTEEVITLTAPGGGTFEADQWYYIVSLPCVFSKGITLTAYAGNRVGTLVISTENLTFSRGTMKQVSSLNARMTWETHPVGVYYGPQNSFCTRANTDVVIDVAPRRIAGKWQRSGMAATGASAPSSAVVLWGSAVASLSGTILTMRSASEGSSLVAVKDDGGNILWSYLLWVTASAPAETTLPGGAVILPPLGGSLYFQWGRKDPLLSGATRVENAVGKGLSYAIAHPGEFIKGDHSTGKAGDWFCQNKEDQDDSLWGNGGQKTVWDPCPEGYRVPSEADYTNVSLDFKYLTDHFAVLGYINSDSGFYGTSRTYWTRTVYGEYAASLDDTDPGYTIIFLNQTRDIAAPIRCVKE
jgi:hypothetical protein